MKSLEIIKPEQYFSDCLKKALKDQKISFTPEVSFYLINLLCKFVPAKNFNPKPLAFMLKDALEGENSSKEFKYLGDFSLYTAGFFPDSLKKKLIDVDYYIGMGKNAYGILSKENIIFNDLSREFSQIVDVFNQISEESFFQNEEDVLRIYQLWQSTDSPRLKKKLAKLGIITPDKKQIN